MSVYDYLSMKVILSAAAAVLAVYHAVLSYLIAAKKIDVEKNEDLHMQLRFGVSVVLLVWPIAVPVLATIGLFWSLCVIGPRRLAAWSQRRKDPARSCPSAEHGPYRTSPDTCQACGRLKA